MLYSSVLCCVCDEACCVHRRRCTKFVVKSWAGGRYEGEDMYQTTNKLCACIRRAPLLNSLLTIGLYMVRLYT